MLTTGCFCNPYPQKQKGDLQQAAFLFFILSVITTADYLLFIFLRFTIYHVLLGKNIDFF